jgi:urocanate hydratase
MKGKLDRVLEQFTSRKLMVFIIATALALFGDLTSGDWVTIAGVYIGTQGAIDAIEKLKR